MDTVYHNTDTSTLKLMYLVILELNGAL